MIYDQLELQGYGKGKLISMIKEMDTEIDKFKTALGEIADCYSDQGRKMKRIATEILK